MTQKLKEQWKKATQKLADKKRAFGLKRRSYWLTDANILLAKELEKKSLEEVGFNLTDEIS